MQKRHRISEAEWEIMEVVWRSHPITSGDVWAKLADENKWAPNTVRTMLARLVKKGILRFGQEGNSYLYRPAVEREQCVESEVDSLLQRLFGGAAQSLLVHFVENKKLSAAEVEELREFLNRQSSKK
jgi:BlaI family penicillinase repressor